MSRLTADTEYLSDVWTRINSVFAEQKVAKCKVAKKCGFDRKTLIARRNISITYFARLCEELNVSADFFLFGVEKDKEKTNAATYIPDKCYKDMPTQKEIIKEAKKLMVKHNISVNNMLGISAQKELMTLADDFGLLHREDIRKIIETCKNYEAGHKEIMQIYEEVYM